MQIKRVLHIIPSLKKGGAERLVIDICKGLNSSGMFESKLIVFRSENEYKNLSLEVQIEIIPSEVKLSVLKKNKFNVLALQKAIESYKPHFIHTHLFEAEIVSRSCFYPNAVWFSHCHDNMPQLRKFGFKTILSKKRITNFYEKQYLIKRYKVNLGTKFLAISKDGEKFMQKHFSKNIIIYLKNAIEFEIFRNKENKLIDLKPPIRLLNIGSFVIKKNQKLLIEIAKVLTEKGVNFSVHFLGDGETKETIQLMTKEAKLENSIHFHGNVDNVEEFLWQSDLYVHTALYEPLGLVILEAMAAGVPVISLDGRGNRDIVVNGENGFLIMEQDAQKFANRIIALINNKEEYSRISKNAVEYAKNHDIKQYIKNLIDIYMQYN
jgi:glycosyltransferase involved in cell wall biosynthesis